MPNWLRRSTEFLTPKSLAGRAAACTAALVASLILVASASAHLKDSQILKELRPLQVAVISILSPAIPILMYIGVRIWGREDESLYPDIDEAWKAGIEALNNVGLLPSAGSVPFFLVLGGGPVEDAFVQSMRAAGETFRVKGVPTSAGVAPVLRWYATDSGIYVFCARVGALGSLMDMWAHPGEEAPLDWGQSATAEEINSRTRSSSSRHRIMVSVSAYDISREQTRESAANLPTATRAQATGRMPTNVDFVGEGQRLAYVCRMIYRARRPRCGINGAVVLLPFEFSEANKVEIGAIASSIKKDLQTVHRTLRLRFPVNGLVVSMEQAVGFTEFANLLGRSFVFQRLGARFDVYRRATTERLQRMCDRICDTFEDFVYVLFVRPNALSNSGENRKLYRLLCRVRGPIKPKLFELLSETFVRADRRDIARAGENDDQPAAYFSGCYLAATGVQADEQAFVKGVLFDKLVSEQGKVEWTGEAQRAHIRFQIAVFLGWAVFFGLLVLAIVSLIRFLMK